MPYTFDRIGRGTQHIPGVCISVLGNTQPARISEYIRRANAGGTGGDGLIQRFGLLVWPDNPPGWRDVDAPLNPRVCQADFELFQRMAALDQMAALRLGALMGPTDKVPYYLRFSEDAHAEFLAWRHDLERNLRSGEMPPALEGHLAKYRKLVPTLALLIHLDMSKDGGSVSSAALKRALAFAKCLQSHARRIYGAYDLGEVIAAKWLHAATIKPEAF